MSFGRLPIEYDARVLRPRLWTVQQSTWAAEILDHAPAGPVLELCSGAGQIGLLATRLEASTGLARPLVCVDTSPVACAWARHNATAAGLADLVEVRCADLRHGVRPEERFAVVIADPPWVPSAETGRFPEDPSTAIDGGPDGLDVARVCVEVAAGHLLDGGSMLLQLGSADQAAALARELDRLAVLELRAGEGGVLVRLG